MKKILFDAFKITMCLIMLMILCFILMGITADTTKIDEIVDWIAEWVKKIGLVVAFFGGIQTVLGFKNEDADGKVRGLKTMAAGFMLAGIGASPSLFGL